MKKFLLILILVMGVSAIYAQRTPVMVSDLNKAIIDNVAKDYVGFTIKEATKVVTKNVVTYDVVIVKGTTQETLLYDKDGKFVKKIDAKKGTAAKKSYGMSTKKPATTKTPVKK